MSRPLLVVRAQRQAGLIVLLCAIGLSGCGSSRDVRSRSDVPQPQARHHTLHINEDGDVELPAGYLPESDRCERLSETKQKIRCEQRYAQAILDNFAQEDARAFRERGKGLTLVLYIHGGLNTFFNGVERSNRFTADMLEDGKYPVFIAWNSAALSNYRDHLFSMRNGEMRPIQGAGTSPFVLVEDLLRSTARLPEAWWRTGTEPIATAFNAKSDGRREYERRLRRLTASAQFTLRDVGSEVDEGRPDAWMLNPVKFVTAPFVDGLGAGAWRSMLRRTTLILSKSSAFEGRLSDDEPRPEQPAADSKPPDPQTCAADAATSEIDQLEAKTAVARFLELWLCNQRTAQVDVELIGHSMGAFVAGQILARYPALKIRDTVYMGAAVPLRDVQQIVVPWLRGDPGRRFFNLSLEPLREVNENAFFDFVPRGSLLHWIDNILGQVNSFKDRTAGTWRNMIRVAADIFPDEGTLRQQVHLTRFPHERPGGRAPIVHGDFDEFCFWRQSFWTFAEAGESGLPRHRECGSARVDPQPLQLVQ